MVSLLITCLCAITELQVVFTGDLLLDRGVRRVIEHRGADAIFSHSIDSLFHSADAVVANLECPVTNVKSPLFKRFVFRGEPEWLPALKRHGITHLNMANNHTVDQGRQGIIDTRTHIIQAGMVAFGADSTMHLASKPLLLATEPRNVYVIGTLRMPLESMAYLPLRPSVSMESRDTLLSRISQLRRQEPDCYIIVCPHWGIEHTVAPTVDQRRDARLIIDAGADCIIGHHTHTVQTTETYRNKPIYYSIGNFIFDQQKPLNAIGGLVRLIIKKQSATSEMLPIMIKDCQPRLVRSSVAMPSAPVPSQGDT